MTIGDRRPTRIRLPLHPVEEAPNLTDQLFDRFAYARVLLPAFARQIRQVVVEGGPAPGVHAFNGVAIDGALGWSVGAEAELPKHAGRWRILRFRPADSGREDMGTTALAVGLRDGVPTAFSADVPFLWNVTPTDETWGCGYVVNGPFKLDPGRTHVSVDDSTTRRTVARLGEMLGRGLITLHEVLTNPEYGPHIPLGIHDGRSFLSSLWRVLAGGLSNAGGSRRGFLLELHGNGRGLSAWMAACSAAPSGLSAPFRPVLPRLTSDMRIEVASDTFDNHVCAVLAAIQDEDLADLVGDRCIVSAEIAQLLRPLDNRADTEGDRVAAISLRPSNLFAELAERWGNRLTPARLHALRPIDGGGDSNFDLYDPQGVTWRRTLKALAADGSLQPLRNLLLREAPDGFDHTDPDASDELRRAAFAPARRVLDPAYIERVEDWRVFRWLRVQHGADADSMAGWCMELPEDLYRTAIAYLLYGTLAPGLLSRFASAQGRPHWLHEYEAVRRMVEAECDQPWRCELLLGALFPDRFRGPPQSNHAPTDSTVFFQHLSEWWDDRNVRHDVISAYEAHAWPEWLRRDGIGAALRRGSEDHWLALLVLGACRGFGRTQSYQHRAFLEMAYSEGWWDIFKVPDDPDAWMAMLRRWQDEARDKLPYRLWMSLFPTVYQLSRFRDVYVRLLRSVGRRPSIGEVSRLLAPRVDDALTGAGTQFDAPPAPLDMGLHWTLRELVRFEVIAGEHLHPDCWVPSRQVIEFLELCGFERLGDNASNSQKAHAMCNFLAHQLGTEIPTLHLAFDIPLRHVASNDELRERFGLAQ